MDWIHAIETGQIASNLTFKFDRFIRSAVRAIGNIWVEAPLGIKIIHPLLNMELLSKGIGLGLEPLSCNEAVPIDYEQTLFQVLVNEGKHIRVSPLYLSDHYPRHDWEYFAFPFDDM